MAANDTYLHGHAEPVLRSHRWRTVENSAAYLLPHLREGQDVLDVGCGPATITIDIATRFPTSRVVGIDPVGAVLEGVPTTEIPANLTLRVGDIFDEDLPAGSADVVHAHQVLQHLADPVDALRRMRRLCRPGGVVAVRDVDYGAMSWAPSDPELDAWYTAYAEAATRDGHQPNAGRHLLGWALDAGFTDVTASASVWCFATPTERAWWAEMWADRVTDPASRLSGRLEQTGRGADERAAMAAAWHRWAAAPDGWFAAVHGELIARVPSSAP
ncbi:methyltransferase domain-containing protein [Euzebya tangerina]|uniref:methyltransferase domain-containing protein n=1 Tax=Euzebya tangerina TaxID=591198 RepID=UPI000E31B336|nr:methyltransferase domain-containing protein [Euzebya tangerina]